MKFATYAAQRGYHALVYDYRGMGSSAVGPLAKETACMSDWGRLDMPGALDFLWPRFPSLPAFTLGHSVGGQLLGCLDNANRARAHVMVAAATAYWGRQSRPFRYLALTLWNLYGPLMLQLNGFVPRGTLWTGQSLPPEVFRQWRRWGLDGARFGPALDARLAGSAFGEVQGPALALGFTDDPIATPAAVQALLAAYTRLRVEQRWASPAEARRQADRPPRLLRAAAPRPAVARHPRLARRTRLMRHRLARQPVAAAASCARTRSPAARLRHRASAAASAAR